MLWNFTEQVLRKGLQLIVTIVLAYLLLPEDFGLIAMISIFMAIANSLMESGLKQALIIHKNSQQIDYDTAFYANIALGIIAYTLLFLSSPIIADFYNEPRLIDIIRVVGVVIVLNAFSLIQITRLTKELNFKLQLTANVFASVVAGVIAILLAYWEYGVWALIAQMIVQSFIVNLVLWRTHLYKPQWQFSWVRFKQMYHFGYKLFISGMISTIYSNMFVAIIAKLFVASTAGLYYFAEKLKVMAINQLIFSIQNVTFPALAKIQDDENRLKENYRKIVKMMAFVLLPIITLLSALAHNVFIILFDEKWWHASSFLSIMLIGSMLTPLHAINVNILQVKGRSDLFLCIEIIKIAIASVVIYISIDFGIYGILIGQIITSMLCYIPNVLAANHMINYSMKEQLLDFFPTMIMMVLIALGIYQLQLLLDYQPLLETLLLGVLGLVIFLVMAYVCKLDSLLIVKNYANSYKHRKLSKSEKQI